MATQEQFKSYIKTHQLEALFNDITSELIKAQPEKPIPFIIEKLQERQKEVPSRKIIFVLGGPGSGKGTQCERLVKRYKYVHFSAGDLLREQAKKTDTDLGRMVAKCIEEGKIVPGEVTIELLRLAIFNHPNSKNGTFLIDGFPREMKQALDFERLISPCTYVLFFDCPMDVLEQRLLKRGESSGRSDDNIESIKKRFVTFQQQSMPVIEYFSTLGKVERLDSSKSVDQVFEDVQLLHEKYFGQSEHPKHEEQQKNLNLDFDQEQEQ